MKYKEKEIGYIIVPDSFVTVMNLRLGKTTTLTNKQSNFNLVCKSIEKKEWDNVIKAVEPKKAASVFVKNKITIRDGKVYCRGEELDGVVVKRILQAMEQGKENLSERLCAFLDNLMDNPSYNSRKQLYGFLVHNNIPISEDGCILAYKKVDSNYYDLRTHTILNNVWGKEISMNRADVDDNPDEHCSSGLHIGDLTFVKGIYSNGHIIICKVNPKDVVSIPNDFSCTKMRCCAYTPICDYKGALDNISANVEDLVKEDKYTEDWYREELDNEY